ncbi:hypothetical protein HMP0721_1392 [Pseudoramibacter alactolyticus ATCC 23263]|uniref:Uncharacterized protein n=1 Tax=Pseudoramibacter alactolyticus ATCC 23263 TaxID=887929 RepID=E6MHA7_9FIRM|nr:hypothetical protein HMP0721_1392 [Pseudoramibacter alactolyticus ATCC 23263]
MIDWFHARRMRSLLTNRTALSACSLGTLLGGLFAVFFRKQQTTGKGGFTKDPAGMRFIASA